MKLKWKEVKEGIWEAKTDVGVFTIESGKSEYKPGLGYFAIDVTKEGEHIACAFDSEQAKKYARNMYKKIKNDKMEEMKDEQKKICCNCKHGGKQLSTFLNREGTHLHCCHPKYDGSESAWETLNEIWDGCEDFELKIKELK